MRSNEQKKTPPWVEEKHGVCPSNRVTFSTRRRNRKNVHRHRHLRLRQDVIFAISRRKAARKTPPPILRAARHQIRATHEFTISRKQG